MITASMLRKVPLLAEVPDADDGHPDAVHAHSLAGRRPARVAQARRAELRANARVRARARSTFKGWPDR